MPTRVPPTELEGFSESQETERAGRLIRFYATSSRCSRVVVHAANVRELLPEICRVWVEQGGMRMAWIGLVDESGMVRPEASCGAGAAPAEWLPLSVDAEEPAGRGPTGISIREGRAVWCRNFLSDPRTERWHEHGARHGWASSASLPFCLRGRTMGVLTLISGEVDAFDAEIREMLTGLAEEVGFAMEGFALEEEARKASEMLLESEERYRTLFKAITDAVVVNGFDRDGRLGKFQVVNDVACELLGYSREELLTKSPQDLDAPESRIEPDSPVILKLKAGEAVTLDQVHIGRDGRRIPVEIHARPFLFRGQPSLIAVIRDLTERKRSEQALRESERRFRLLLQNIPSVAVQGYYPDGTLHYWNHASGLIYGFTAEEAVGKNILDLIIPPEMREDVRQAIAVMAQTGTAPAASELTLKRKDGSPVTVYSSHSVVMRPGRVPELFCVDVDMTDRKRAEEALEELNRSQKAAKDRAEILAGEAQAATRAKSEFLAVMSHELRTPLNGVIGFAELLSLTSLDAEQQSFVRTILDSGTHLLHVVNDILDFSSIERGGLAITKERYSIADLIQSSCAPIRETAAAKGLGFHCEVAPDVPDQMAGDARRIRQILINLLGNAVKFTERGSVVLRIAPVRVDNLSFLEFSVEDTGPGIPADMMGILFNPFTQVDSTARRRFEGTGLGLTISRRLAEAMGGSIGVVSQPGKGSTFSLRLPLEVPGPASSGSRVDDEAASGALPPKAFENPVLVVEDDPVGSSLVGSMLASVGLRVEFAANGREALEAFAPGKYAAIIMDLQMPVMDGIEATRQIRARESDAHVPIIALTASVLPDDRERCVAAGMDEFLSKPFKKADLLASLASACPDCR